MKQSSGHPTHGVLPYFTATSSTFKYTIACFYRHPDSSVCKAKFQETSEHLKRCLPDFYLLQLENKAQELADGKIYFSFGPKCSPLLFYRASN